MAIMRIFVDPDPDSLTAMREYLFVFNIKIIIFNSKKLILVYITLAVVPVMVQYIVTQHFADDRIRDTVFSR